MCSGALLRDADLLTDFGNLFTADQLHLGLTQLRDDLFWLELRSSSHRNALLRLPPTAWILAPNAGSFEGGRSLLGPRYDETSENRRFAEIVNDAELMARGKRAAEKTDPLDWLEESRLASTKTVYTAEILGPVRAVAERQTDSMPTVSLSPEYLETAGRMATLRACQASWRLAKVWALGL